MIPCTCCMTCGSNGEGHLDGEASFRGQGTIEIWEYCHGTSQLQAQVLENLRVQGSCGAQSQQERLMNPL